jgi:hypothetical protein
MLERARALAAAGEQDAATRQVDAVAAIDPAHLGLPDARASLASARTARQAGIDARIDAADALIGKGRLTTPAGDNARAILLDVLQTDPTNVRARESLRGIAVSLVSQAQRQMADFEFDRATALLDEAQRVDATVPGVDAARTRLRDLQRRRSTVLAPSEDPATRQRIAQLLADASAAAKAGNLLAPPGDSAYDKYRAVRSLEPDNAAAIAGVAALPALARQRFEDSLGSNRLSTARGAIEALSTLAPADASLTDMRRRLARSLLGQATERLGAGEVARARQMFDQARELDPTNPDFAAMQARLEQAGGG